MWSGRRLRRFSIGNIINVEEYPNRRGRNIYAYSQTFWTGRLLTSVDVVSVPWRFSLYNPILCSEEMAWRQILSTTQRSFATPHPTPGFFRFFSKPNPYIVKVGIPEFLNGVGNGVEAHAVKLEAEIGDFQKLLVTRTLKLKKLGIPCKHRKLILKYAHKYRLGLWRPRAEPVKA